MLDTKLDQNLVLIESPFAGKSEQEKKDNISYARKCMADSFGRGEMPFAGHLLYTQEGILDDDIPEQRFLGIETAFKWAKSAGAGKSVVYVDRGLSRGMIGGIKRAKIDGRIICFRSLLYSDVFISGMEKFFLSLVDKERVCSFFEFDILFTIIASNSKTFEGIRFLLNLIFYLDIDLESFRR